MNRENLHKYQEHCVQHIINNRTCALFLQMGLGKTISTLTALNELMCERFEMRKALVIAPAQVVQTVWKQEAAKWGHTQHLRVQLLVGTPAERMQALRSKADVYVISRDNVAWLVAEIGTAWPFDGVVIDELSSFKNPSAVRFKALKKIRPLFKWLIGLTGTPAPNGLTDLWAQMFLVDGGKRLGPTVTSFRDEFCIRKHSGHGYDMRPNAEQAIYDRLGDICISMTAADYLDLPERINRYVQVEMGPEAVEQYKTFKRDRILELLQGEVTALSAGVLSGKLLQFANGAVYDAAKVPHTVHDAKLEALEEIIEEAVGNPVLVFYWFKHDLERLQARFPKGVVYRGPEHEKAWNERKLGIMFANPVSMGHGLNLQAGGNIVVWFSLTWNLEVYQQANARLDRQGQKTAVIVHHLIATGTMDEKVMAAIDAKADAQDALMDAVKAEINEIKKAMQHQTVYE